MANKKIDIEIQNIKAIISEYFKVKVTDLDGRTKPGKINTARHVLHYILRTYYGSKLSFKSIGHYTGGRHYSSIIDSVKTCQDDQNTSRVYRKDFKNVNKKVAEYLKVPVKDLTEYFKVREKKREYKKMGIIYHIKREETEPTQGVRPSKEMPTVLNEWLKPLSRKKFKKAEVIKPVYFG